MLDDTIDNTEINESGIEQMNILDVFADLDQLENKPVKQQSYSQAYQTQQMLQAMIDQFGSDQPGDENIFIAPDGTFINLYPMLKCHQDLAEWLRYQGFSMPPNGTDFSEWFVQTFEFVRCRGGQQCYIQLPLETLTRYQRYSLETWLQIQWQRRQADTVQVQAPNGEWKKYSFMNYLPENIIKLIQRFYSSDHLYQKSKNKQSTPSSKANTASPRDKKLKSLMLAPGAEMLPNAQRKVVMTPTCIRDLNNATQTLKQRGISKLAEKLPLLAKRLIEPNTKLMQKIQGIPYTAYQVKLGKSKDNKPARFIGFMTTDNEGTPYFVLSRFFQHTEQKLTKAERQSAAADYYQYIQQK